MKLPLATLMLISLSACVTADGVCPGLKKPTADTRSALLSEGMATPETVGDAATRLVLASEAGCRFR